MSKYIAALNGEEVECTLGNWQEKCDELKARHGGGQPKVFSVSDEPQPEPQPEPGPQPEPQPQPGPQPEPLQMGDRSPISENGKTRSTVDLLAAKVAGFAPVHPHYERGTRVNEMGVENARLERLAYDEMELASDAAQAVKEVVEGEARSDCLIDTADLRMGSDGVLMTQDYGELALEKRAFNGLLSHLDCGGWTYLAKCPPPLRAKNVNFWARQLGVEETTARHNLEPRKSVLRTRQSGPNRSVFAVVTPTYTAYDVDMIAEALRRACPTGAKGVARYDGRRAQFQVVFHSDVRPEEYVAGEFFRAGVYVDTADDGSGAIVVRSLLWQNLCLNLICIDKAEGMVVRIRHVGSVEELAAKFSRSFDLALQQVEPFAAKWNSSVKEDALSRSLQAVGLEPGSVSLEEGLPGLFGGILERDLVPVPVRANGGREAVVNDLVRMYRGDGSAAVIDPANGQRRNYLSRAAVVNAFTRYAHDVNSDPWAQQAIERGAGSLLWPKGRAELPEPLPYLEVSP